MERKIPLHIITGFLGVGKTTTILGLLEALAEKERVAVIVNERGEVGLDREIMDQAYPGLWVSEVNGGCICCTAGAELDKALEIILGEVKPDRLLLEPSGVAKPGDIIDLLAKGPMGHLLDLRPVVGLVEPKRFVEGRMMSMPLYRDQVEAADILVANHCDRADQETLEAFAKKAEELFPPKAKVITTSMGKLPMEALDPISQKASISIGLAPSSVPKGHEHYQEAGRIWPADTLFSKAGLEKALRDLIDDGGPYGSEAVQRLKGVFNTDWGWFQMEIAVGELLESNTQHRRDNRCQVIVSGSAGLEAERYLDGVESSIFAG